jgi:hypothetical protein
MGDEELGWGAKLSKLIGLGPRETDMAVRLGLTGEEMPGSLYSIALLPIVRERSTERTTQVPKTVQLQKVFQMYAPMA